MMGKTTLRPGEEMASLTDAPLFHCFIISCTKSNKYVKQDAGNHVEKRFYLRL
jgi:hypothetical protein